MAIDASQVENVTATDNPQQVDSVNSSSSDASLFQESAGMEALNQKRELQVVQTGKPIATTKAPNTTAVVVFVVIASILLIMIAMSVFKWVMKRPEPTPEEKAEDEAANKPKPEFIRPQKKVPRSKRRK